MLFRIIDPLKSTARTKRLGTLEKELYDEALAHKAQ